jgi:hypothetical protein
MVGYSTYYTMIPVFSLVLDNDVNDEIVFKYPELYKELQKGRELNLKTFLIWVFKSIYQGFIILSFIKKKLSRFVYYLLFIKKKLSRFIIIYKKRWYNYDSFFVII